MSDESRKPPTPRVQVIRRPASTQAPVRPVPVVPVPVPVPVVPVVPRSAAASPPKTPVRPLAPLSPLSATTVPRLGPAGSRASPVQVVSGVVSASARAATARPAPLRGGPRSSAPRAPPTTEAIAALAKRERVPSRIAKGELEGKMKCRVWKKLHAEEATRFDQAWTLVETNPDLELADAFGVVQSGLSVPEFLARRARAKKREAIKQARATVAPETVDAFVRRFVDEHLEAAFVLGERTILDVLKDVQPVSFELERTGRLEKLNVVALATRGTWERLLPGLERDPRLSHKPAPVARQPARRPVNDPRPFLEHVGQHVTIQLRNGLTLSFPLHAVGPFDVLLGDDAAEVFVPLHAMLSWAPSPSDAEATPAEAVTSSGTPASGSPD